MARKPTKKQWQTTVDVLNILLAEVKEKKMRRYQSALEKTINLVDFIRPK